MTRTARLSGAAAAAVAALTVGVGTAAHADAPTKAGWFYELPPPSVNLPGGISATSPVAVPSLPSGDPSNSLVVGGGQGVNGAIAAVEYKVPAGTPGATLTLQISNSGGGAPTASVLSALPSAGTAPPVNAPVVDACGIAADTWAAGGAQSASAAPSYTCVGAPMGTVSSDGTKITFHLGAPFGGVYDLALVPDAAAAPFTAVFAAPDASSLTVAAAGVPEQTQSAQPTPDTTPAATPATSPATTVPASSAPAVVASAPVAASAPAAGSDPSPQATGAPAADPAPAVAPLPSTGDSGATSAPTTAAPAAPATTPDTTAVQPAASTTPAGDGKRWLFGAAGLGLVLLGLLYGATKQVRAPKLLGSLSIGSLKKSADD